MKKVALSMIGLLVLALFNSCASMPAQRVTLSPKSVEDLRRLQSVTTRRSRSARFLSCIKELNFEGMRQELLIPACEAAMGKLDKSK